MSKAIVTTAAISVAITAAAFLLNPGPEQHRARIREAVAERRPLAGALGVGALTAFASDYHSFGIASYTELDGRKLSFGAFGYVHVLERDSR